MIIKHLAATASADQVAAALAQDGAVIVDRLVTSEVMDNVADELRPFTDATRFGPDNFSGRRTKRTGGLVGRSQGCRDLVMNRWCSRRRRRCSRTR
jgi:hypothetical protein